MSSKDKEHEFVREGARKVYSLHGKRFEVPERYSVVKVIGYGAYGLVTSALDNVTKTKVAIKKCQNVCKSVGDGKRILREAKLLRFMDHENVLGLSHFFLEPEADEFKDAYFVTELLDTDLNTVIRSRQRFTDEHLKYFIYQVLRGLKYMHSANVMHRDIKPANLLCNINCDLKIADFGLSRAFEVDADGEGLTDYVVTRWYRPPELLLMNRHYTPAIDIWSTGCIFMELLNRKPIFPGKDYLDQLSRICAAVKTPPTTELDFLENPEAVKYLKSLDAKGKLGVEISTAEVLVPSLKDEQGKDFLAKMMTFDPRQRATAAELLAHPFMGGLHDPTDEPVAPKPFTWDLEDKEMTKEDLHEAFKREAGLDVKNTS